MDLLHDLLRQTEEIGQALDLVAHQHGVRGFDGDIRADTRLWLPVSAYLIEHPKGKFLVDTGWARDMSPKGVFDKKAQIKSLGSWVLYKVNQGRIPLGACIDEQLAGMGLKDSDLDATE